MNSCLQFHFILYILLRRIQHYIQNDVCVVYTAFCYSVKRRECLKEFEEFTDVEHMQLLKHRPTRWLSLQRAVTRILLQYPALLAYFASHGEVEKPGRVKRTHATAATQWWVHCSRAAGPYTTCRHWVFDEDNVFSVYICLFGLYVQCVKLAVRNYAKLAVRNYAAWNIILLYILHWHVIVYTHS